MLFLHPGALYRFEVPDEWLQAAGTPSFVPLDHCYAWLPDPLWAVTVVDVQRVTLPCDEPPPLARAPMVRLLQAMVRHQPLAALPGTQDPATGRIVLDRGMHRLHAALALRYRQVPVVLTPRFAL